MTDLTDNRKPCREGHSDCIGRNTKDDRCKWDPSRCEGKSGRHIWNDGACIRCGAR